MRYRLMASYLGASYQAAVGPSDRDVTLFAAPPPPEEHGFSPVPGGGIWRKQVRLDDLDGLWESRPIGSYHGEPCLVLDDLGDRLHIVYLGMDERRAGQLGYWQVDRGVFEVVVQRHEVTDLAEERHEFPIALLLSALPRASAPPRALNAGDGAAGSGPVLRASAGNAAGNGAGNGGNAAGRMALASGGQGPNGQAGGVAAWNGQPAAAGAYQLPAAGPQQAQSAGQQPMPQAIQPSMSPAQTQAPLSQPGTAQTGAVQPPPAAGQPSMAQPAMAQQFSGSTTAPAQQAAGAPRSPNAQPANAQPANAQPANAQPANAQPANAQPPAAVVAWHGSPVADGNGTWYYQPNIDPQTAGGASQNGTSQNGISQHGIAQNGLATGGYAPVEQAAPAVAPSNGMTATPQFAQPAPAAGYQQAPPLQPPAPPPPTPQFPPSAVAPAPSADAGATGTTGTTGGMGAPVNLGMPLSAQAPLAAPPAATPTPPAPPVASAPPAPPTVSPSETSSTGPISAMPLPMPVQAPTSAPPQAPAPPLTPAPAPVDQSPRAAPAGPLGRLTGAASAVRGRRAARKPRLAMSAIFADLVDMADVPRSSYAVDEEVTGAMCLFKTDGGYEVFSCAEDARHEVRFFEDEEAAYFYLFGVLAAEALRNGRLAPRRS
jgi:hypothetical protein